MQLLKNAKKESQPSFNLVIEMLFNASRRDKRKNSNLPGFNLVIEMLFNASCPNQIGTLTSYQFQSRNRDAFQCNEREHRWDSPKTPRFNLVIEMLFNATRYRPHHQGRY